MAATTKKPQPKKAEPEKAMRIVIEFAGQRIPATLSKAKVPDADGFSTNVTCLRTRAGAVAFGASVIVLWSRYSGMGVDAESLARSQVKLLENLGYRSVLIEREFAADATDDE